ncbi:MAG: hypothetical protein N2322_07830, partial [Terrimicrobiaceae bacterium]|nr:hypothetical protein [Terrimicrobiaceae bacterium]
WPAFLGLQACAALAVVGYYQAAPVRALADWLLEWKVRGGPVFVAAANVLSGAVLPELLKAWLRPPGRRPPTTLDWIHLIAFMAVLGVAVDAFYQLQGWWFGGLSGAAAVAAKILVDQFGYTLFFAVPFIIVWFAWREHGFRIGATLAALRPSLFAERLPPLFIPNTLFWIPALAAVYSLPTPVQFLLFVFLNGAWCLIMVFVARELAPAPGSRKPCEGL